MCVCVCVCVCREREGLLQEKVGGSDVVIVECPPAGVLTACNTGRLAGGGARASTDLGVVQVGLKPVPQVQRRLGVSETRETPQHTVSDWREEGGQT